MSPKSTGADTPAAVILAAGFSSRMGAFKPLLPLEGQTVLSRVIRAFQSAGIAEPLVVSGHRGEEVRDRAESAGARVVHNGNYADGMFTSIQTGVGALPEDASFFVHPVDIPLVRPDTIRRLVATFQEAGPGLIYPRFQGRRGHPPLIGRRLKPAILGHSGEGGLRAVLGRFEDLARDVDVDDEFILVDIDRPEDYIRIMGKGMENRTDEFLRPRPGQGERQ